MSAVPLYGLWAFSGDSSGLLPPPRPDVSPLELFPVKSLVNFCGVSTLAEVVQQLVVVDVLDRALYIGDPQV